jgi:aminoglycoside 3-N-acetyltransferase I
MADFCIQRIAHSELRLFRQLLVLFGQAFAEIDTYCNHQPGDSYLEQLLRSDSFIAVAALENGAVVGGLAAYELRKFEQERSELYIYDLAVSESHRRRGIARALISELKLIGAERGAYVVFVQADHADQPAIELYSRFGRREEVLQFDIDVPKQKPKQA